MYLDSSGIVPQIVAALVIIGLFVYESSKDKSKFTVDDITLIAFFAVLSAILGKVLSIKIPPQAPFLIISLGGAISVIAGMLFSPKKAIVAGLVFDVIGIVFAALINEGSSVFIGFTLNAVLACYIPSKMNVLLKNQKPQSIIALIVAILVFVNGFLLYYLISNESIKIEELIIDLNTNNIVLISGIVLMISIAILILAYLVMKHYRHKKVSSLVPFIILVMLLNKVISILLTAYWIFIMFKVPIAIGIGTRIVTNLSVFPFQLLIVVVVFMLIPMKFQKNLQDMYQNKKND